MEKYLDKPFDMRLKSSFSALLLGPSRSGKTRFAVDVIRNANSMMTVPPTKTVYFYQEWNPGLFDDLRDQHHVSFFNEVPTLAMIKELCENEPQTLVVIDDYAMDINSDMATMFNVTSHHLNCNFLFLAQNTFNQNKYFREMTLNATYIIMFKNIRDKRQIKVFAQQFMPQNTKFVTEVYARAMEDSYAHLIFDLHQSTPETMRVYDRFNNPDKFIRVFQPKKK